MLQHWLLRKQLLPVLQLVGSLKKQHHAHRSNQQNIFQKIWFPWKKAIWSNLTVNLKEITERDLIMSRLAYKCTAIRRTFLALLILHLFIPKKCSSAERRLAKEYSSKGLSPQSSHHKRHPFTTLVKVTIKHLEKLAGILRICLFNYDKCKLLIGLTVPSVQLTLIMHLEYQVTLPGHNYVTAPNHKFITSVIGKSEDMKKLSQSVCS